MGAHPLLAEQSGRGRGSRWIDREAYEGRSLGAAELLVLVLACSIVICHGESLVRVQLSLKDETEREKHVLRMFKRCGMCEREVTGSAAPP